IESAQALQRWPRGSGCHVVRGSPCRKSIRRGRLRAAMMEIDTMAKQRSLARPKSSSLARGAKPKATVTESERRRLRRLKHPNADQLEILYPDEQWYDPLVFQRGGVRALMCRYCMFARHVPEILKDGGGPFMDEASFLRHLREKHDRVPEKPIRFELTP